MSPASRSVLVRSGSHQDIPTLCALLGYLFAQEAEFTPNPTLQERALRAILDHPHVGQLFCAEVAPNRVGMVSLLFTISTAEGGLVAWLEDMVVHPLWRGAGIGKALLETALESARTAGCSCSRVTLLTDESNTAAPRFYERAGFVRSPMTPFRVHLHG